MEGHTAGWSRNNLSEGVNMKMEAKWKNIRNGV